MLKDSISLKKTNTTNYNNNEENFNCHMMCVAQKD